MTPVRIVLVTAPDEETAARLAHSLLEERLIACANLLPRVRSIYRWEGEVQDDAEVLLVLKTVEARLPLLALDRIWARSPARVRRVEAFDSPLARVASDHRPVRAWVCLDEAAVSPPACAGPARS